MLHLKPYYLAILLAVILGTTLLLTACGQTGDLYLPGEESEPKKEKSKN